MSVCPYCHAELAETSRQLGRCATCGSTLRALPQRTVAGLTYPAAPSQQDEESSMGTLPDASPHLPEEAPSEPLAGSQTVGDASDQTLQTVDFSASDFSASDVSDADVSDADVSDADVSAASHAPLASQSPSDDWARPQSSPAESLPSSPTPPPTISPKSAKPPTVALDSDRTIDFRGIDAGDVDFSMVTSQWAGQTTTGIGDPRKTIRQHDTVSGSFQGSSSVVVKPRRVRPAGESLAFITSAADAPDYELLNIIGEGGMGVVYAARQSAIARTVAVKMLKGGSGTIDQREKFISEAVVTGELDHPNIVPIYDMGANDEGALFYSMKRVKGTPWSDAIGEKSLDENLNILLRVCDAVAFAHVNGVIHRDLKPENVMLGDYGEVLVMDWGLARISPDFPNADSVAQSSAMGGTPAYMAPEMATGPIERITAASDVYLLGAILHEIITGRPPHKGISVMDCLFAASKNKLVETDASGELYDVALHAMATDPDDRFSTVKAFQDAVREYQAHSESIVLTNSAAKNLGDAPHDQGYDLYARAVYGLEESLALWPGNRRAEKLLSQARLEYAERSLEKGDYDLGASLLDPEQEAHRPLVVRIAQARRERSSRQRLVKLLKGAVAALVAAVVAVVSFAYYAVSQQRDAAIFQRDRAVRAEGEALANFNEADKQRQLAQHNEAKAVQNADLAEQRRQEADTQRNAAVDARQLAEQRRAEADRQRGIAVEARQAEEYAAYVARIGLTRAKIDENAFDRAGELLDECTSELRHWEWGRLRQLCQLSQRHWSLAAPASAVAYAPDGRSFASGDWSGRLSVWDLDAPQPRWEVSHGQYVHSVAYDAQGKRIAAAGSDHTIRICDATDGKILAQLNGHDDAVLSVRFSPDGRWLASSGHDNTARIWDLETGQLAQTLRRHSWWVWGAEFSPDGTRLVTAGQDGKAIVWQRTASSQQTSGAQQPFEYRTDFGQHRGPVYAALFSPSGRHVVTAGYDGRVLLWNPDEVQPVDVEGRLEGRPDPPAPFVDLVGHRGPVRTVAFSREGRQLATGGQDNLVILWDLASGAPDKTLRGHASHVRSVSFAPDGMTLLSAGRDRQIKLWRPDQYAETLVLGGESASHGDAVLAARFSRDGRRIATAGRDRIARLWDLPSLRPLATFAEGHEFLASSAVFFAQGTRLATGGGDGSVRIWDVTSGAEVQKLAPAGSAGALDVSPDGKWIATGGPNYAARVWDATQKESTAELVGHEAEITTVAFGPDATLLVTADQRGVARIWRRDANANHWRPGAVLRGHSRTITSMALVDGGARLLTASGDNTVGQWDLATGKELRDRILKHPDWVADLAVDVEGKRALTCCDDGKVRLWDVDTARVIQTLELPPGTAPCTSVDLSVDGRFAAAVRSADGTVHVWDLTTGEPLSPPADSVPTTAWLDVRARSGLVWAARFSPSSDALLTIGGNDAQLRDLQTAALRVRFSPHGAIASVDLSPDGTRLATGSWDGSAKIWSVAQQQVLAKLDAKHQGYINSVHYSPDGKLLVTASDDGDARLWDALQGTPIEPVLRGHQGPVLQACFSPDGSQILTVSSDKTARLWDARGGATLRVLQGHEWGLTSGAFAMGARRIITGSEDNVALVWDAATGQQVARLAGHTGAVTSVALSSDGRRALTGSEDNLVKVWDAEQGKEVLSLAGHHEAVTSVSFSPDDLRALSSGRDGQTIVWPAADWREP